MLKKTITFNDLDGNPVTEDFYFSLNKAEIAELEFSEKGGLSGYVEKIIATEDNTKLIAIFKDLILRSVGRRSEDNRRFVKSQDIIDDFTQTEAYSELFVELATKTDSAIQFINGIVPKGLEAEMKKVNATENLELPKIEEPAWITENREPTQTELQKATPEQLRLAFQRKNQQ